METILLPIDPLIEIAKDWYELVYKELGENALDALYFLGCDLVYHQPLLNPVLISQPVFTAIPAIYPSTFNQEFS